MMFNNNSLVFSALAASLFALSGTAVAATGPTYTGSGMTGYQVGNQDVDHVVINRGNVTPANELEKPVDNTLQKKVRGPHGELLATQPGRVEINQHTQRSHDMNNTSNSNDNVNRVNAISTAPLLKGERSANQVNRGNITPANMRTTPAPITLQQKIQDKRGELVATQPGEVEIQETRHYGAQ